MVPAAWTRIEGTALWEEARAAYARPAGRTYHSFGHVLTLYGHADRTFELPYDAALDLAVLAHDVVIDRPGAEARSRAWLLERPAIAEEALARAGCGEPLDRLLDRAGRLILATERHRPSAATAPIVLLDLADFLDPEVSRANSRALREEAWALRGWTEETWARETLIYLAGLSASLDPDASSRNGDEAGNSEMEPPALTLSYRDCFRALRAGVDRVAAELAATRSTPIRSDGR